MERKIISLNRNWRFCRSENWCDAAAEIVCLPHSVRLEPENYSGCRNYQGPCLYRKEIFIPKEWVGKKITVEFEGIMGKSRFSVNGILSKEHFCGYIPLVADIGMLLKYGEINVFEVFADNSDDPEIPPGKPQKHLDFAYEGGIYRNARMTVSEPIYITHPLLANEVAGGGIFVWYTDVSENTATVHARVHVKNETENSKELTLLTTLIDGEGNVVGKISEQKRFDADEALYFEGELCIDAPKLWSPETPNLYTLRCEISDNGNSVFEQDTEIGIRHFEFTLNDGVIFNGKSRRFSGVNYHQNWPYIGNAVPDSLFARDMMKLKEMGCENIRSHYPFSTALTDVCNRLGLTIIVSNPGWQFCRDGIFMERALQNIRDIVRWQRNNPCVLIWEPVLNESKMSYDIQLSFHNAVHQEFPYNPCYTASDWGPTDIAYKDYDPGMLGKGMENYGLIERDDSVERPRWVREYGDAPDNFSDQNSIWRCKRGWGDFVMSESVKRMIHRFDTDLKDSHQYIDVVNNKSLCGFGVWPGIAHNRGYHINPCWGGHLDLFRMPKFSYYFMQSQCERELVGDVLYVASWWTEVSPVDVMVFSNAERVALYRDDEFLAEQYPDDLPLKHPPFTFKDAKRKFKLKSRSKLIAKAFIGDELIKEITVESPGIARNLKLEVDDMGIPLKADGFDIAVVRCNIIDWHNNIVPITCDEHPIVFEVEGEGEIVGDASVGANPVCADAGTATVLVRSTEKAGEIRIKARMLWEQSLNDPIMPDEIVIKSE